jgi:hypothetical protein
MTLSTHTNRPAGVRISVAAAAGYIGLAADNLGKRGPEPVIRSLLRIDS